MSSSRGRREHLVRSGLEDVMRNTWHLGPHRGSSEVQSESGTIDRRVCRLYLTGCRSL